MPNKQNTINVPPKSYDDPDLRPHMLYVHSYKSPTFCDHCAVMLFGLVRQGLKCEGCNGNFHKKCAFKIPNNCSGVRVSVNGSSMPRQLSEQWSSSSSESANSAFLSLTVKERRNTWSVPSKAESERLITKLEIPHTFVIHSYKKPTLCHVCRKLLKGLFRQGYQCKDCKFNCHRDKRCTDLAPRNCLGERGLSSDDISDSENTSQDASDFENTSQDSSDFEIASQENEEEDLINYAKQEVSETISNQIPLQRLAMSVRNRKMRGSKILKSGWMVHFTESDKSKKVNYWRLDTKSISFYESDSAQESVKEIPLSEIFSVDSNLEPMVSRHGRDPYLFTLKTSTEIYYCGERDSYDANGSIIASLPKSGKGTRIAISWAEEIRSAFQSVSVSRPINLLDESVEESKDVEESIINKNVDISLIYQVFSDEILGSGQFGIVYGGVHRKTGKDVAVKVIDKSRFPTKEERALKNEVTILQNISHPAVVNLEKMFETPERIFVVMQKMKGDMLEMILSSKLGRLTEMQTKFICHQILTALHFLHQMDIVHCDLKPENVLLSGIESKEGFPQIKLCDFGFSRIIGRESFRRSVVGTPAYLAPEVLSNKKYNRSLDMWSVGVIIYVSVSGTFPFNEEEDISDQIKNAAFMYPPNPWAEISKDAQDLINQLLQVKMKSRLTCQQALLHVWMQDLETYLELRCLEKLVGKRYITHESDDVAWARYDPTRSSIKESIPEEINPKFSYL
ncbi:serine/threonine-protein kinase D1 isoform X2 [Hydra vulgaris]|uniref:serine/threonine-protein kinase D1 isoform X2 n=1 Tax=Hydra vulgaris TaxID=6087 RepID=UPI001F5EC8B9|nr:serine/threonine-protein kinase D1 isoform X2 [Hydra vulgaris]